MSSPIDVLLDLCRARGCEVVKNEDGNGAVSGKYNFTFTFTHENVWSLKGKKMSIVLDKDFDPRNAIACIAMATNY